MVEARRQPLLLDDRERFAEAEHQRHRRCERGVVRRLRRARRRPVQVKARKRRALGPLPCPLRHPGEGEAGRRHQRLLRARHHHVEPPLVRAQVDAAEAGDGIHDHERSGRAQRRADRLDVVHDAGRGLRVGHEHRLRAVGRRGDPVGVEPLSPRLLDVHRLQPVRPCHLEPPLAEVARGGDHHAVAGRAQVHHRRLHRRGAGPREHEHLPAGLEHPFQRRQRLGEQLPELRASVVHHRRRHRRRDPRWDRGRTWGDEVLLPVHGAWRHAQPESYLRPWSHRAGLAAVLRGDPLPQERLHLPRVRAASRLPHDLADQRVQHALLPAAELLHELGVGCDGIVDQRCELPGVTDGGQAVALDQLRRLGAVGSLLQQRVDLLADGRGDRPGRDQGDSAASRAAGTCSTLDGWFRTQSADPLASPESSATRSK